MTKIDYKFDEAKYVKEIKQYIKDTYKQHYATSNDGKQTLELIDESGWSNGFVIGNIIKYASRYGHKSGYQRKDLLKIIHYAILQLYFHDTHYPFENTLTQKELKKLITYDEHTGEAYWKVTQGSNKKGKRVGRINERGYRVVCINGNKYRFSRLVWLYMKGYFPRGEKPFIDHINNNKSEDHFLNLRECSAEENARNRRSPRRDGLPKGVRVRPNGRFQASIKVNGKEITLGTYDTAEEAGHVYAEAAKKYHKEFYNTQTRGKDAA